MNELLIAAIVGGLLVGFGFIMAGVATLIFMAKQGPQTFNSHTVYPSGFLTRNELRSDLPPYEVSGEKGTDEKYIDTAIPDVDLDEDYPEVNHPFFHNGFLYNNLDEFAKNREIYNNRRVRLEIQTLREKYLITPDGKVREDDVDGDQLDEDLVAIIDRFPVDV